MKRVLFVLLFVSYKMFGQAVELKPGSNGFVMIPNVSTLGACGALDKGKIVYYSIDNSLRICNGSNWTSLTGFTLPYANTVNAGGHILNIQNSNPNTTFSTIHGTTNAILDDASGVTGRATNTAPTGSTFGINGTNASLNSLGAGVSGFHSGTGSAIQGTTFNGIAGKFYSSNGYGIKSSGKLQLSIQPIIYSGQFLKSINSSGDAEWRDLLPYNYSGNLSGSLLLIENTHTTAASTIFSVTNSSYEVGAVYGVAYNTIPSLNPSGVKGVNNSTNSKGYGVFGEHNGYGTGVYGSSDYGFGVKGKSATNYGVHGWGGNIGVWGHSEASQGVQGSSTTGIGGFFTSTSGYALITEIGRVGIGISTPNNVLDVNGRMRIRHTVNTSGIWFSNSANSLSDADGAFYGMKNNTESGIWIGNAWRFWVTNTGNATLLGTLTQSSDKRLKKDFLPLNNSLSDISNLNGYHYKWIEESRSKDLQTGLIAQEVQKIFPELVQTDEKGFLSVNYIGLVPHLIEAVKELRDENNSLKTNNKNLASRLDKIEALLTTIHPNTENSSSNK